MRSSAGKNESITSSDTVISTGVLIRGHDAEEGQHVTVDPHAEGCDHRAVLGRGVRRRLARVGTQLLVQTGQVAFGAERHLPPQPVEQVAAPLAEIDDPPCAAIGGRWLRATERGGPPEEQHRVSDQTSGSMSAESEAVSLTKALRHSSSSQPRGRRCRK